MKDGYCPWCDKKYETSADSGPFCDDCRSKLLEQPKEFLVDMLGHVAGVNALAMAALTPRRISSKNSGLLTVPKKLGPNSH